MENLELLFEKANNGDAMSQYKLGRAYESGDGVEKNLATARMWYQKSADNGYKNAEVKLRLLPVQQESDLTSTNEPKKTYQAPTAPRFATAANTQPNNGQNNVGNTKQPKNTLSAQNTIVQKAKTVAALLAIFLGCFGAHDFYLGYKKQGIIKIVLTITIIGSLVSYVWALMDFIKILCNGKLDSNGQLLK